MLQFKKTCRSTFKKRQEIENGIGFYVVFTSNNLQINFLKSN